MASKTPKPPKEPKVPSETAPPARPLMYKDLARGKQSGLKAKVKDTYSGGSLKQTLSSTSTELRRQAAYATDDSKRKAKAGKANRLDKLDNIVNGRASTMQNAVDNRVDLYKAASGSHESLPDTRMPHESVAGSAWYFESADHIAKAAAKGYSTRSAATASSVMSPQTTVENERGALSALTDAGSSGGKMTFHPDIVQHLASTGVQVPTHLNGQTVDINRVPGAALAELAKVSDTTQKANLQQHTDVNLTALGAVGGADNAGKAHDMLRGAIPTYQHPGEAPKTASYTETHVQAATPAGEGSNSDEAWRAIADPGRGKHPTQPKSTTAGPQWDIAPTPHSEDQEASTDRVRKIADTRREYEMRVDHVGRAYRGEVHPRQAMFDFGGLRDNNEGILSNNNITVEDSWQKAASQMHRVDMDNPEHRGMVKGLGDLEMSGKSVESPDGSRTSLHSHPDISAAALEHAFNNKATIEAAHKIQRTVGSDHVPKGEEGVDFAMPSTSVQESGWTSLRRMAGADSEFNKTQRGINAAPPKQKGLGVQNEIAQPYSSSQRATNKKNLNKSSQFAPITKDE